MHERTICPHGTVISTCRCINAATHTTVVACPIPDAHAGRPVTAGWTADGQRRTDEGQSDPAGVWMAYNGDGSACVPFAEEIEAYRHAAPMNMSVRFVPFGEQV